MSSRFPPNHLRCGLALVARCAVLICLIGGSGAAETWPWRPFEVVQRPPVPANSEASSAIDAFLNERLSSSGLTYRQPAPRDHLLRRVYLDLIGLAPTPEERAAFLADASPAAYEKVVDRLLADPRHAERWARHWMDVWRYSDWAGWADGKQIRDSQPHIWRWRDWIIESLVADTGYDRMITDMLAADERAPNDPQALRATGFLVRNYKMLSREQWLQDTVKHTSLAFMGLTVGCAQCHNHKTDPIQQTDYYALRAIFEPHQVRIDHLPGQADTTVDGLPRAFDADVAVPTFFLPHGDERSPDKDRIIAPAVPGFLGGSLQIAPIPLPAEAVAPQRREFVRESLEKAAQVVCANSKTEESVVASAKLKSLQAVFAAERLEDAGKKELPEGQEAAKAALAAQREEALAMARAEVAKAEIIHADALQKDPASATEPAKKLDEAKQKLSAAEAACSETVTTAYKPRELPAYPAVSSGRRLAFAKWLTQRSHPLTARVAVNHVWARHFGAGLVPALADFGKAARPPSHPELLDWLAAEFMEHDWSFRHLHRLICLSQAYQQGSAESEANSADPDNRLLWHFPSRRLEAEAVRDNLLHLIGGLDLTRGGPEIDQSLALTSGRRSLYFRCAAEKQPEFLQVFDGPSVVECFERKPSVMPQQALALLNSDLVAACARTAAALIPASDDDNAFVRNSFIRFLTREPTSAESDLCIEFLQQREASGAEPSRSREMLLLTLLNHHETLTLR